MNKTIVDFETGQVVTVPLTPEEIAALGTGIPEPTPQQQIDALEREHMLPKVNREFMLSFMETMAAQEGAAQGLTPEQSIALLRAGNSGYRKVKELDEQIEALRGLM